MCVEQYKQVFERLVMMGKEAGIDFAQSGAFIVNTWKAHKLMHLAKKHNKQSEMKVLLFEAHFISGKNVAHEDVVVSIAALLHIAEREVRDALSDKIFLIRGNKIS